MSSPRIAHGIGVVLLAPDGLSSVYFQPGDDAGQLEDDLEKLERAFGYDKALEELWAIYGHLAQPERNAA